MKTERELRSALATAKEKFETLQGGESTIEELRTASTELKEARERLDIFMETQGIDVPEKRELGKGKEVAKTEPEVTVTYSEVFDKALRGRKLSDEEVTVINQEFETRKFQSEVAQEGQLIIPVDAQTAIQTLRRQFDVLEPLVNREVVGTLTGSRVIEKQADMTAFVDIEEWAEIAEIENPKFDSYSYKVNTKAGILPVPRTLLQDESASLQTYISNWIARKSAFTRSQDILTVLNTGTVTATIADFDDLKRVFNVTLDPAIAATASIVTNQDGYNYLDTLKDTQGRYIIQPLVTDATKKGLFGRLPITVLSNAWLPSTGTGITKTAPIFIGDLKEGVTLFDRNVYEVVGTDVGGKAFTRNTYDIRVIDRYDVKKVDDGAYVVGSIVNPDGEV